jgi:hypothetical protein
MVALGVAMIVRILIQHTVLPKLMTQIYKIGARMAVETVRFLMSARTRPTLFGRRRLRLGTP